MRALLLVVIAACGAAPPPTALQLATWKGEGRAAADRKDYATCATTFERARLYYDAAACHANDHHASYAYAALDRAPARDLLLIDVDPDLATLRADRLWPDKRPHFVERVAAYLATVNVELAQLYTADQSDRMVDPIDWKIVEPRDRDREARANAILAAGGAKTADDYFHAAMILQHAPTADANARARELCLKAIALDPHYEVARWLAAAALDRTLMRENKPQKYGTQFHRDTDGPWQLWAVDPATTDAERAEWNVPPLAQAMAHAEAMNHR